jgi:signal transduction histidine kinase
VADPPSQQQPPSLAALDELGLRSLLAEVVERVEGVAQLADRLQGLLEAVVAIGSQLDLDQVLHEIVTTAAELAGAQYAALGVLDPHAERRLSRFITVGIDADSRRLIGDLPHGRGVLGLLIDEPRAIRLHDLAAHPASYGFPAGHPPMHSFLGVPVLIRGVVYGNLYLTEKRGGGDFTATDEQIVLALATAAGLAVQNANLYEQARLRQRWLEASSDITTRLLGGDSPDQVFPRLVSAVRELAAADTAFLALPVGDGTLRVALADGAGADLLQDSILPERSLSAQVMSDGRSVAVADARTDPRIYQGVIESAGAGPGMFVPLGSADSAVGTLVVTHRVGGATFTEDTIQLIASFAGQATIALRLGAAAQDRERLAVLGDRDRIARDLHDLVIQRLFATGMSLEGALRGMEPPATANRVQKAVDDLDDTIKEIRTTIFALQSPAPAAGEGLRTSILHAAHAAAPTLGFEPHVTFDGPVDTLVPQPVGEQMLAVLREALSNAARHAKATTVAVCVTADPRRVTLAVQDDGVGLPADSRRSGLDNLAQRARDLGGTCDARAVGDGAGAVVTWSVPLPPP